MGWDEEFRNSAKKANIDRLKQEKDDHNNEMADRETGRQERFGFGSQRQLNETRKKQQEYTLKQLLLPFLGSSLRLQAEEGFSRYFSYYLSLK